MVSERLQHSLRNVFFFGARVPQALRRRFLGARYLDKHPEFSRAYSMPDTTAVCDELRRLSPGITITPFEINDRGFSEWLERAQYPLLAYHASAHEKFLEHYLSVELLADSLQGTLMDVASCRSYFPVLMRARGLRVIVQDLVYTPGLHGDFLGCNAADMPLPSDSVDAMTLHCSFEHFEDSADTDFVREAYRVIKPGGRVVIIPLYLHQVPLTWVDPYFLAIGERIEEEGASFQPSVGYGNRFGRMYDPKKFVDRVYKPAVNVGWEASVVRFLGLERHPGCYAQFALVLHKPR